MPAHYEFTDEIDPIIDRLIENDEDHKDLKAAGVTVGVLFFSGNGPLMFKGWPARAYIKKTSLRDRAMGVRDAVIVVDKEWWQDASDEHRVELIDHELWHIMVSTDGTRVIGEGEDAKVVPVYEFDSLNRPKLIMRKHDIEIGIFLRDAMKYGPTSMLREDMVAIADKHGQLLFGFGETQEMRFGDKPGNAVREFADKMREMSKDGTHVEIRTGDGETIFTTKK